MSKHTMNTYIERVARNLEGLEAVSTGLCPGCDECRSGWYDYTPREDDWPEEGNLEALAPWTLPARPGERWETEQAAEEAARAAFDEDISNGQIFSDGSFSRHGCDICDSSLGGDFEPWHGVWKEGPNKGELYHGERACVDCLGYLANGELPEGEDSPDSLEDSPDSLEDSDEETAGGAR